MKLVTLHQFETAIELLRRGLRVSIVSHITGIHSKILRSLYREIHGCRPRSGQLPSTSGILSSRAAQATASVFAATYLSAGGSGIFRRVDLTALLSAHGLYLELTGELMPPRPGAIPLDITHAWVIARDVHTGAAYFAYCGRCRIHYLLAQESRIPTSCPICALKRRRVSGHITDSDDESN